MKMTTLFNQRNLVTVDPNITQWYLNLSLNLSQARIQGHFLGGELGSFRLPTLHSLPTFLETGKIAFLFAL